VGCEQPTLRHVVIFAMPWRVMPFITERNDSPRRLLLLFNALKTGTAPAITYHQVAMLDK
jgi:hypothetical protein